MSKITSKLGVFNPVAALNAARTKIVTFAVLTGLVLYLPTLISSQPITGTLVNMSLILAVLWLGPKTAVVLGLMPSLSALFFGLLPTPLALLVPFIISSNIILILTYHYLRARDLRLVIPLAAFLKFVFLWGAGSLVATFLISSEQFGRVIFSMMGIMQFITAVSGGVLAYIVIFTANRMGLFNDLKKSK